MLRALQLHLGIVYLFGGLNKVVGPAWHNGEALWKAAQQSFGQPFISLHGVDAFDWLWIAVGWGVVLLELSYPFLVWWRRSRPWILGGVVIMHLAIAVLMGLYAFSALMILLNLVAFYYPYIAIRRPTYPAPCPSGRTVRRGADVTPNNGCTPATEPSSLFAAVPLREPP